ncbi:P-loop NTPase fold protein [uncultured Prevotella sp.]|nr:P-loop NTPase fold protein [uncultured Prevotella sp.]
MLPISIGVFGNWGAGKSSLMLLLQRSLQEWEKFQ